MIVFYARNKVQIVKKKKKGSSPLLTTALLPLPQSFHRNLDATAPFFSLFRPLAETYVSSGVKG